VLFINTLYSIKFVIAPRRGKPNSAKFTKAKPKAKKVIITGANSDINIVSLYSVTYA